MTLSVSFSLKLRFTLLEIKFAISLEIQIRNQATTIAKSTDNNLETKGLSTINHAVLLAVSRVLFIVFVVFTPRNWLVELDLASKARNKSFIICKKEMNIV